MYHKEGQALRTEITINDTRDFAIGRCITDLDELRKIGFAANRRLDPRVQALLHVVLLFVLVQAPSPASKSGSTSLPCSGKSRANTHRDVRAVK